MSDDPARPPRFPYVAALLCAACVGVAVYCWMRYSYVWGFDPDDIVEAMPDIWRGRWPATAYVRITGCAALNDPPDGGTPYVTQVRGLRDPKVLVDIVWPPGVPEPRPSDRQFTGRIVSQAGTGIRDGEPDYASAKPVVDSELGLVRVRPILLMGYSRFHGASIAGLVVGAMGVFVFTVALRHWLGERRKFGERDEGA